MYSLTQQGNIEENLAQLDALTKQLRNRSNSLQVIPSQVVLSGEIKVEGEIRTLAQLFALEYQKIKQGDDCLINLLSQLKAYIPDLNQKASSMVA